MKTINFKIFALNFAAALTLFVVSAAAQVGVVKFDYEYKSNAQGKVRAEQQRGRKARMYWNPSLKRWTVEVDYGGGSPASNDDTDFSDNDDDSRRERTSANRTRKIVYHYEYKSNAQGKLRVEQQRGKTARMFYDKNMRRWAVEVEETLNVGDRRAADDERPTVVTNKRRVNTSADVGSGSLPNGATVSYFPDKQMAEEIHRAAIRQGDWTKMWYDENRRAWAVAIKVR